MINTAREISVKKEVLTKVIEAFLSDDFKTNLEQIPNEIKSEDANVTRDRIIAGLGYSLENSDNSKSLSEYAEEALNRKEPEEVVLTVLSSACHKCEPSKVFVTDLCQGCTARPCEKTCKFGAISVKDGKSSIDQSKCKSCKMCISVCPYQAITKTIVPCEEACPTGAIGKDENGLTKINTEACISCGRCIAGCPFGAIQEKSQIIDVLKNIKGGKKVIAMFAPAVAGQFGGNGNQLKTALLKSGFTDVYEVAQGADTTTRTEAKEFEERMENGEPFMTTSCCAGYNELIKRHIPEIKPFVSDTKTPLYYTAEIVKKEVPDAITVFISPCTAKRKEIQSNDNVNYVMGCEDLSALLSAHKIVVSDCEETAFPYESSKQSKEYALSGGVTEAVKTVATNPDAVKAHIINGLSKDAIKFLKKVAKDKVCEGCNLIEVMCCDGGCVGGNTTVNNTIRAKKAISELAKQSKDIK